MVEVNGRFKTRIKRMLRRFGVDVVRYPGSQFGHRLVTVLKKYGIDVVLDIGANRGQYAQSLREFGYSRRIVSFEPLRDPFEALEAAALNDPCWEVINCAVGSVVRSVVINVAANGGASSSILPMLDLHRRAAPGANYVGTSIVQQDRLGRLWNGHVNANERAFVKIDVQGYEREVLAGADGVLDRCHGVQLELSFAELYEGSMQQQEAFGFMKRLGLSLVMLDPIFFETTTGQILQADAVFMKTRG